MFYSYQDIWYWPDDKTVDIVLICKKIPWPVVIFYVPNYYLKESGHQIHTGN